MREEEEMLRDVYAGLVMLGMVTGYDEFRTDIIARKSFDMADAMIAERAKRKSERK